MIEYELVDTDWARIRFAVSPLNETVLSLRAVLQPARYPWHRPWLRALPDLTTVPYFDVLRSMFTPRGWSPDFLSPVPVGSGPSFAAELEQVACTPAERVRADLASLPGGRALEPGVSATEVLRQVVVALASYWTVAIEPHWPRLKALLEADIAHRGRRATTDGLEAMLADLSDRLVFEPPSIRLSIPNAPGQQVRTDGTGLALVPSLFALHTAAPVAPSGPSMIIYAARGVATAWDRRPTAVPGALAGVLGGVRATLLTRLAEPASSTELALDLGVTPSAVNQHLRALRSAGLLESSREGKSVRYRRTGLADELLRESAP